MKKRAFWALLAAGMTVVSTGVVSAQWTDRETLTRIMAGAAGRPVTESLEESTEGASIAGMRGVSTTDSLVGSWIETATFDPPLFPPPTSSPGPSPEPRVLKSLVTFHDDGTIEADDQGSVTTMPPGDEPPSVFTPGAGVWARLRSHTFTYTQYELISDLSGDLAGFLKVRGTYNLTSEDHYTGRTYYEVFIFAACKKPVAYGWVTNAGKRIHLKLPPKE
jgi:hypothetical protein